MRDRADLHLHTTASDGTWSPSALVASAVQAGLRAIAVTDHDTVDGVAEATRAGSMAGVEVISGVELSVEYQGVEIHLLGYGIDPRDRNLEAFLARQRDLRHRRIERMVDRLRELGYDLSRAEVRKVAGEGSPGRPHVARVLVEKGYVDSVEEAFDRLLGDGRPGYVPRMRLEIEEGIATIHAARGCAVVAHPGLLADSEVLNALVPLGLDGIEVVHSAHTQDQVSTFSDFAERHGLLCTGGSDAHGPGVKEGVVIGQHTIPYDWVVQLRKKTGLA